jgi:hypothetical protein
MVNGSAYWQQAFSRTCHVCPEGASFHFFSHNTCWYETDTVRKLRKQDLPTLPHSKLGWEIQAIQMPTCFFKATSRKHVMQVIPTDNAAVRCVETKTF